MLIHRLCLSWRDSFLVMIAPCLLIVAPAAAQQATSDPRNTQSDVGYIGSESCIECHQDQHQSFLKTTHAVSAQVTDVSLEPEPGSYDHPLSGFRYEVEKRDGKLIHREIVRDADGNQLAVTEHPMAYSIGSGTHGKSYLFRDGPFLGQSPLTWYEETGTWKLSPGWDKANHYSFRRTVRTGCVFCHVGIIDRKEHNPYQFEIVEQVIGCERCHGPGQLHAKKYRENPDAAGIDPAIVNPDRLDRSLSEAICQQCHLQGAGKATVSNRDQWDFRPGLPLTDFHVDYRFDFGRDQMRIVGHVEQMHDSKCYTQTETLTCTTCHDPHDPKSGAEKVDFYRSACQQCHQNDSCAKPLAQRVEQADNSCYVCHMPKADTVVTHAALHHHRIGIHTKDQEEPIADNGVSPILDLSGLSARERDRCMAIAKVDLIRSGPKSDAAQQLAFEATETLIRLKNTGPLDPLAESMLAWLAQVQGQQPIAEQFANSILKAEPRPTLPRIEATSMLGEFAFKQGQKERAAEMFGLACSYHRDSRDLFYLGLSQNNLGKVQQAIATLNKSLEIDPTQLSAHMALRAIYEATGQPAKAAIHAEAQLKNAALLESLRGRE